MEYQFQVWEQQIDEMDLKLVETGDGGDAVLRGNDLVVINGLQNMPYIALFGGNVEASTPVVRPQNEQSFDWWGNSLLMFNQPSIQFNSLTERLLKNIALTPSGRTAILNAVLEDVNFMREFATIDVEVAIVSVDRLEILIKIQEPDNLESNEFTYIWDSTNMELSMIGEQPSITSGAGIALNNLLNFEL